MPLTAKKILLGLVVMLALGRIGAGVASADESTTTSSTTTSSTTTTTIADSSWRFSGSGTVLLLDRSENQIQVRGFATIVKGDGNCSPQSSALVEYSISPDDGYGRGQGITSFAYSSVGLCSPLNYPFEAVAFNGLRAGRTYTICMSVSHGVLGSASACGTWTTLGGSISSSTSSSSSTTTPESGSASSSSTTTVPNGGFMVLLDTQSRVVDVWTRQRYDSWDPYQLPRGGCGCFAWVPSSSAPYAGMIYDGSGNFNWPTTTTTSVSFSTVPDSESTSTVASSVTPTTASGNLNGGTTSTLAPSGGTVPESGVSTTTVAPVEPGSGEVVVGGATIETSVTIDTDAGVATVSAGGVTASLSGEQSEQAANVSDENSLVFNAGDEVSLNVSGFQPESEAEAIVYSEPRRLGVLRVDAQGNLNATVELPPDLESGNHTLVLSGVDSNGNPISVKFGLIVFGNDGGIPLWMWVLVGLLIAVLFTSVSLNLRQRGTPRPA